MRYWYLCNLSALREGNLIGFQLSTSNTPGDECIDGQCKLEKLLELLHDLKVIVEPRDTSTLLNLKAQRESVKPQAKNYSPSEVAIALALYGYNVSPMERAQKIYEHFNGNCAAELEVLSPIYDQLWLGADSIGVSFS